MLRRTALALPLLAGTARAQSRPIRLVVPYTPGGGADTSARLLAGPMGAALSTTVIVENRAGSAGMIGAAEVARSAADGQTLLLDALAHVSNGLTLPNLPFDYARAFAPIGQVVVIPQILVVPMAMPVRGVQDFVAYAKARAGQLAYGTPGNYSAGHLTCALFCQRAGIDMVHVPYRGGSAAVPDVIGGSLAMMMATVSSSIQLVRDGRLRALGVTTAERLAALPEVPSIAEQGYPGFELNEWNGLFGVAGTPAPVLARLHAALLAGLADAGVRERMAGQGSVPVGSSPEAFTAFLATQRQVVGALIRDLGPLAN
jgi:tripartite-type tricarboxylate transporter receptor subunit TctC